MNDPSHQAAPETNTHLTVDVMGMRPHLRDDLTIQMQTYGQEVTYLIEDPLRSKCYRVGLPEYTFLSMLDGRTTIAEAAGRSCAVLGNQAMTDTEIGSLCKWLVDSNLATTTYSISSGRIDEATGKQQRQRKLARLNLLSQKLPLASPSRLLESMTAVARCLFNQFSLIVWSVLVLSAFALA